MTSSEITIEIAKSCKLIREALDREVSSRDIEAVNQKLLDLTMLDGTSAESLARAKKVLHIKELQVFQSLKKDKLSASIMTSMLKAECYEEHALVVYCDRLNAGIHHAQDALRTMISLYKTEIQASI